MSLIPGCYLRSRITRFLDLPTNIHCQIFGGLSLSLELMSPVFVLHAYHSTRGLGKYE